MTLPCIALVVAAGRGTRFGGPLPKQYRDLPGGMVLGHTLRALGGHPRVDAVRVVIHPDDRPLYDRAAAGLDGIHLLDPVPGGASRQDSVRLGLESLEGIDPETVLIHDAARPRVAPAITDGVLDALAEAPGAIPALPVVDTIKRGSDGVIAATVDRSGLFRAQTPQGFRFHAILAAHRAVAGQELTDDAAVAEAAGLAVRLVAGEEANVKITTEPDLMRMARDMAPPDFRTASGFDVHRFGAGDHVMVGGVAIPHDQGLEGHSDADVCLHALTDALLGTVGAGDIGALFPPSEARWKGAASSLFIAEAVRQVTLAGGTLRHVDVTIICQKPRIGPHRVAIRDSIADLLGLAAARVSVKATTTEGLGFTGRGEGMAVQATATVAVAPGGIGPE